MTADKWKFLVKAALVGILGMSAVNYSYTGVSFDVQMWITVLVFIDYFRVVLLFWIAFENQIKSKKWIFAGLIGSLIYALSFWVLHGVISPQPTPLLNVVEQLFIGAISAIPIWIVLKPNYTRAHLWIEANVIGYAFVGFFPVFRDWILSIEPINKATFSSFLTVQVIPGIMQTVAFALFGLFLGIILSEIIKSSSSQLVFEKKEKAV
jgi:hypothetical protein